MKSSTSSAVEGAAGPLRVERLTSAIGAEVSGVDLSSNLSDTAVGEIRQALLDHQVLVFREQDLTTESHIEFARRCGTRPHRVGGLVARMGMLNIDGFAIVEHDRSGGQVRLHRQRLVTQYGLGE